MNRFISFIILALLTLTLGIATSFAQVDDVKEKFDIINLILSYREIIGGVVMAFSGALVVALIIPGEQPDKFLQGAIDFLKKFSQK